MADDQDQHSEESEQQADEGGQSSSSQSYDANSDQQGETQQDQQGDTLTQQDTRDQASFDSQFQQLMGTSTAPVEAVLAAGSSVDWVREYFDQAEQTIRSARRVAELQTLSYMRQQIVADVTREVWAQITANPGAVAELLRQGSTATSSGDIKQGKSKKKKKG